MKVEVSEVMFQKMLNAVKNCVSKDECNRPVLKYIRLKVENGMITAMVCDGCSGARFKFAAQSHDGENFVCIIKPISFKASKSGFLPVVIELLDGEVLLDVPTEYGNLTYHFKQMYKWDEKLDDIFDKMKVHDREIGMNAALMARIMNNFASVSNDRNKCVVIETKESKTEGIRMYAKDKSFEFEQFLLPLRMQGD